MRQEDWEEILREAWESAIENELKLGVTLGMNTLEKMLDAAAEMAEDKTKGKAVLDHLYGFLSSRRPVPIPEDDQSALILLASGSVAAMAAIMDKEADSPVSHSEATGFLFLITAVAYQMGYHRGAGG